MNRADEYVIGGLTVLLPGGTADIPPRRLAPRLPTLAGARIGILDNCKEFADLVLAGAAGMPR